MIKQKVLAVQIKAHTFRLQISGINGVGAGFWMLHVTFHAFPQANDMGLEHQQL